MGGRLNLKYSSISQSFRGINTAYYRFATTPPTRRGYKYLFLSIGNPYTLKPVFTPP